MIGTARSIAWPAALLSPSLALSLLLGAGCHRAVADHDEPSGGPKRVRCAFAEARDVQDTVELHGTVSPLPDRDAQIAAQVPGRIVAVLVREGDRVQKGQPLARIDDAALADQAKQAAAQLAKARAESNLAGVSRARVQRVFERGIAARQELDDAETRLATAQASEAEAKAASEIAARQLERASVRSPLGGVVLKLLRKPGELVDGTPATPIVEVGDPAVLELGAAAPAADLVRCQRGAAASIELPALPSARFTGRVVAVSPAVDRSTGLGVVRVSLALGAGGPAPPVGVTGTARVAVGSSRLAVLVPAAALRAATGDEAEVVLCGDDGRAHVTRVRRGITVDRLIEVLPPAAADSDGGTAPFPLQARTAVAVEPVLGIADGDPLERAR